MNRCIFAILASALLLTGCTSINSRSEADISDQGINEVYIPIDLADCFVQLGILLNPEDLKTMINGSEDDMNQYHFGLGMWIRNNWGLWRGSRLSRWFNDLGIQHPDDMSGIILDSFWRHLHEEPLRLDEQVKYYQDYWNNMNQNQLSFPDE